MKLEEFPLADTDHYPQAAALPEFDAADLARQRADAHYLITQGQELVARASLWWRDTPVMAGERVGTVGHFEASDGAAAELLLSRLTQRLREQGCTLAVGPMDGNTWRRYRFMTTPGSEPPFFLEPWNPPAYPEYFRQAGFTPLAHYNSARVTDLTVRDQRIPRAEERLQAAGVEWRPLNRERFEQELKAIYCLSVKSFTRNFLYTPISEQEFLAQYLAIAPYVRPELILMAEHEGELLGYLFGIPDLNRSARGEIDTFIVKTVAVLPGRRSAGLGSVLVAESHRIAHEQGYRYAIHALMHEGNQSKNISAHYAQAMRRYTLYQKRLESPAP
jgi:GNAT superfamily N-acetyltransferase